MKLENKFIAIGLGIAVFFTSGYIISAYFTDDDTKENVITIGKLVEESGHRCDMDTDAWIVGDETTLQIKINTSELQWGAVKDVYDINGGGEFGNNTIVKWVVDKNAIFITFKGYLNIENIGESFPSQDYVRFKVEFMDGTFHEYKVDLMRFKQGINGKLNAHWTGTQINKSRNNQVDSSNEEIELPSEPEVADTPKEDVAPPNEPEVVEPPKEEVVVPSKPDIIEPSKEEIEIQE